MEEIITGTLRIDEIAQDDKKITLVYEGNKYSFWLMKKDGNMTKAFESWRSLQPLVGDVIEAQYKEEDATWEKPDGKTVNFKRRTILNMRKVAGAVPGTKSSSTPKPSVATPQDMSGYVTKAAFDEKIADMSAAFMKMAADVEDLKRKDGINIEMPEDFLLPDKE